MPSAERIALKDVSAAAVGTQTSWPRPHAHIHMTLSVPERGLLGWFDQAAAKGG